jgi:hypothetical protein
VAATISQSFTAAEQVAKQFPQAQAQLVAAAQQGSSTARRPPSCSP